MAMQQIYSVNPPNSARTSAVGTGQETSAPRSPSRKGGGGMVGGQSPFANMMAQEQSAKATGLQLGAQSALTTGLNGIADKLGGLTSGGVGAGARAGTGAMPGGKGSALGGASAQEQAIASLVQQGTQKARAGAAHAPATREDIVRANNYANAQADLQRTSALDTIAQGMSKGDGLLDSARNAVTMRNLRSVVGGFNLKAPVMPMGDSIKSQAVQGAYRTLGMGGGKSRKRADQGADSGTGIGALAAQFESGKDGIAAIGYDRHGGTSYGKFQVASRVGSMDNFLKFLDTSAPDIAKELRSAGPANTGSRSGAMPTAWRKIAAEQPERFEALQEKFIYDSHYKPALEAVARNTPLDENKISSAMQEVLWSTAVQHGPAGAARIFGRAAEMSGKSQGAAYDKKLINNVYEIRAEQFGSSTESVQDAVRNRLSREKHLALNMVNGKKSGKA